MESVSSLILALLWGVYISQAFGEEGIGKKVHRNVESTRGIAETI